MKKKLTLLVAFVLVFALGVAGTFAYLTSSATVTNTFTVGNVQIKLDETAVDEMGNATNDGRLEKGNAYHLLPGHTYTKDPVVTVKAGSENSYVRMLVTVSDISKVKATFTDSKYYTADGQYFLLETLVGGWDSSVWSCKSIVETTDQETNVTSATYEFRYNTTVDGFNEKGEKADDVLPALFTSIVIPGDVDNTALANLNQVSIDVVAQAIQADGFSGATDAWSHF